MSSLTSVVSYSLENKIKRFVQEQSDMLGLSRGKFLEYLIEDYKRTKEENKSLKTYFDMATDKDFLQQEMLEAEQDLLTELAYNKELCK